MSHFDSIIIGFGKGGKTLAAYLAKRGEHVAIVERSPEMYGGTCINIGCIPTKTLVHQAKQAQAVGNLPFAEREKFFLEAVKTKDAVTSALREKNYHNLADNPSVDVIDGVASFVSPHEVKVTAAGGERIIDAPHIFINTGATTIIPPIPGVEGNRRVFTSTSIMNLTFLPHHLVIVGGGYIGLEFASMFASFGSKVTVLEGAPVLIGREDRDIADAVQTALESKGVCFKLNAKVEAVEHDAAGALVRIAGEQEPVRADAVLLATGRRPATEGLNLEAAGVDTDERGAVKVDAQLRTSAPGIWAMGDVKGGLQFTYISLDDFRIVRESLFGSSDRTTDDRTTVSYSVFIDPPLSRIGLNEDDATRLNLDVAVKRLPVAAIPRAKTLGETTGLMKAIVDNRSGMILGTTIFAPESSEIINLVAMAMKAKQPYTFLRDFIFTHPSMSESLNDLFA